MFRRLPRPASSERIRVRMLALGYLDGAESGRVITLTSRLRREGVSTVTAALARAFSMAELGSVLVLDTDTGGRRVTTLLKAVTTPVSMKDLDLESADLSQFIGSSAKFDVDVLTVSGSNGNGHDQEESVRKLLDKLRQSYRVILVDAGALAGEQAQIWLECSDRSVLVYDTKVATREVLERLRRELDQSGITLNGMILNKRKYPVPRILYRMVR